MSLIDGGIKEEGKIFVGPPIKETTELPVHVCGNFSLDPGRNNLHRESPWNNKIFTGPVTDAYIELMLRVKDYLSSKQTERKEVWLKFKDDMITEMQEFGRNFQIMFPQMIPEQNITVPLFKAFCTKLEKEELFPCLTIEMKVQLKKRSYFSELVWTGLKDSIFVEEKQLCKELYEATDLLMRLKVPIPIFRNLGYYSIKRRTKMINTPFNFQES